MTALLSDYSGPFDPTSTFASFSRQALATLGREYLLNGHLQDRVGMPKVVIRHGLEPQVQIAIEEWMASSPIYSLRMQRALNFVGNDVSTVFKNLQLDIGAPHQFMDFQFRLDRPEYGEFWLSHCGALMDVEKYGEERVRQMCHDIEDPTFDATAGRDAPVHEDAPAPPAAARARPTAIRTAAGRCSSTARARSSRITRTSRSCSSRRRRTWRSTCPRATASRAAGPTTPVRSIPASSSRISRTARS
jgi:hypothetical protein